MAAIGVSDRRTLLDPVALLLRLVGSFADSAKSLFLTHRWWQLGIVRTNWVSGCWYE